MCGYGALRKSNLTWAEIRRFKYLGNWGEQRRIYWVGRCRCWKKVFHIYFVALVFFDTIYDFFFLLLCNSWVYYWNGILVHMIFWYTLISPIPLFPLLQPPFPPVKRKNREDLIEKRWPVLLLHVQWENRWNWKWANLFSVTSGNKSSWREDMYLTEDFKIVQNFAVTVETEIWNGV